MDIFIIVVNICIAVFVIAGITWFVIFLINTLDEMNTKLGVIVTILKHSYNVNGKTIQEVKDNDKIKDG